MRRVVNQEYTRWGEDGRRYVDNDIVSVSFTHNTDTLGALQRN